MQQLDSTVIATALPQMARTFHETPVNVSIGMSVYLLTLAVFIPTSGWVADRFGSRTIFSAAITVFTVGSVLCGFSESLWEFAGSRILQAMGGAMMVPVGRLVVLRTAERHELIRAMQYITIPGLVAPVLGPPLGGFITTFASWRWIFFLNIPIGLIGLVLVFVFMQNHRDQERRPFDVTGFLLSGVGLASLMYGFTLLGRDGGYWLLTTGVLCLGALLGWFAVRHARRHPTPLVDLSPLRIPAFAIAVLNGGALFRITIGATPFLWPLMFQLGFGMSAFISGLLVMACTGGDLAAQAITRPVIRRFGFRGTMVFGGAITTAFVLSCALFTRQTPIVAIVAVLVAIGAFRSLQFTAINTLAYIDVPQTKMSAASSLASTSQQMSFGLGVAFGAFALHTTAFFRGAAGRALDVTDFRIAFVAVGIIGIISTLQFTKMRADTGADLTGRSHEAPARA